MSKPEAGQLTITDLHHLEPQTDTEDPVEQAREQALAGGARYRQTARDTTQGRPDIHQECLGCEEHLSRDYVRVFGIVEDGQLVVDKCPSCATGRDIRGGPMTSGGSHS